MVLMFMQHCQVHVELLQQNFVDIQLSYSLQWRNVEARLEDKSKIKSAWSIAGKRAAFTCGHVWGLHTDTYTEG